MKILLAEDNLELQKSVCMILDCFDIDYDTAENGQEAVDYVAANEGEYDLCLMDLEMPIMDGYKATLILRRDYKYFPIVALSGFSEHIVEGIHAAAGMDDWITKPCHPERLLDKINELTVKTYKLEFNENDIYFKKEMPMDQEHAKELRQLKEQGLVKMRLEGPTEREIIAHKNTPNNISYDFIIKKQLVTEFLNRDPDRPTLCDLYRGNKNCIVETFLDEEIYAKRLKEEDELMEKRKEKTLKGEEE